MHSSILKNSSGVFALKIIFTCLSVIISFTLIKTIGTEQFGVYTFIMTLIALLSLFSLLGFEKLLTRNIASYQNNELSSLYGLIQFTTRVTLLSSFVLIAVIAMLSFIFKTTYSEWFFYLALLILPISAQISLREAALRGLHQIIPGMKPGLLYKPFLILSLIFLTYIVSPAKLTLPWLILITLSVNIIILIIIHSGLKQKLKNLGKLSTQPIFQPRLWLLSSIPFLLFNVFQLVNGGVDKIMIGVLQNSLALGIYAIPKQFAGIIVFVLSAVNLALGPNIASLHANKNTKTLQLEITKSVRIISAFSFIIFLFIIFFGKNILSLFGPEFIQGYKALVILACGFVINAACGSVGLILNMTGNEKAASLSIGIAAALNILLNFLLIPIWGIAGAALATALSMVLWNVLLVRQVWQKLKINPTIFKL